MEPHAPSRTTDRNLKPSIQHLIVLTAIKAHKFADQVQDSTLSSMSTIRTSIEGHWKASEDGDIEAEHAIYAEDAILDYPQSGERFRGRATIAAQRGGHPAERHFTVRRISGEGKLWVSECIISYNNVPTHSVSIMEFNESLVVHETQYFADPFAAPVSRAALAEKIPSRTIEGELGA